ncbi:MAG: hypothetical protein ACI3WQ_05705 [Faecousia sp.]
MIGEIRKVITPFYNARMHRLDIKSRPGLIIAKADNDDFIILPVSRVTDSRRIDPEYDVRVDPGTYSGLNLNAVSYVRTHKRTVVHRAEIGDLISDMKLTYEDLYLEVITKQSQFSEEVTKQAIG